MTKLKFSNLLFSLISFILVTSCSNQDSPVDSQNKTVDKKSIEAIAQKYGVKVLGFSGNDNNSTYSVANLDELDTLLHKITMHQSYKLELNKITTNGTDTYENASTLKSICRVKQRSVESGNFTGNGYSKNIAGVGVSVRVSWSSSTDSGSVDAGVIGVLHSDYSFTKVGSSCTREDSRRINFSGNYTYSYTIGMGTSSTRFSCPISFSGFVFTQTDTGQLDVN